jgi:hypothetical protein
MKELSIGLAAVTNVTPPACRVHSAPGRAFPRLAASLKRIVRVSAPPKEDRAMKTFSCDVATVLVSVTCAIAALSSLVVVFAGAV